MPKKTRCSHLFRSAAEATGRKKYTTNRMGFSINTEMAAVRHIGRAQSEYIILKLEAKKNTLSKLNAELLH